MKIDLESLTKLVTTVRVRNDLNDSSKCFGISSPVADALVRNNIEIKVTLLEDLLEQLDEL
jgi:hypothetical protein